MSVKLALVTGASGFLATHLARELRANDFQIVGTDRNPPREPQLWTSFSCGDNATVDYPKLVEGPLACCFHLSGSASVPLSMADPVNDFNQLMPGTIRLIDYISKHQASAHSVVFSSAAVYGNPAKLPVSEDSPLLPISPYGIHKALMENLWLHYSRVSGINLSILRIFSAYGEGLKRQLFWDVFQKCQVTPVSKPISLFGTGQETRDFIHAQDIARACTQLVKLGSTVSLHNVYNLASGIETSIYDAVTLFTQGSRKILFEDRPRAGDPTRWCADVSRLREIGFLPATSLADGLVGYRNYLESL